MSHFCSFSGISLSVFLSIFSLCVCVCVCGPLEGARGELSIALILLVLFLARYLTFFGHCAAISLQQTPAHFCVSPVVWGLSLFSLSDFWNE